MSGSTARKPQIVAVDGQPSEPFEPLRNQFPMGPGARFELMFDMPREAGAEVKFVLRWENGAPDIPFVSIRADGDRASARAPIRAACRPIRRCRPRSRSRRRAASTSP